MFASIPIIGLSGGIGSGKSFVAAVFGELGCGVISSDELVQRAYETPAVRDMLRSWWGEAVFKADGEVNRRAVADRVFDQPLERKRLEDLLHPAVADSRQKLMAAAVERRSLPVAFVWDSPLLFETGLDRQCDAIVFVEASRELRLQRVTATRGWSAQEMARRENSQMGLDIKRRMSNYSVVNTADAEHVRDQVRALLPRIIARIESAPDRIIER